MEITELDQTWKGRKNPVHYVTSHHYAVRLTEDPQGWELSLRREALEAPIEKNFEDTLLEDYLEEPQLFGAFEGGELLGILELAAENWNNRLRVSNLWVREGWRRRGIGRQLMRKAEELAAMQGRRALVLETQSCNDPALCFYRACGFALIGCDLMAYSNADAGRQEVRLEMGKALKGAQDE
ncbi:MAG: GNAT family N-acetyltransferase [Anaerolineaceae bacterium]